MKEGKRSRELIVLAGVFFLLALCPFLALAVPQYISYQGKLMEDGIAFSGDRTITFSLWDNDIGGNPADGLWNETQSVEITEGIYNVEMGLVTPLPANLHTNDDLFLQVDIQHPTAGIQRLSPLMPFNSTMFALKAANADTAVDADTLDGMDSGDFGDITEVSAGSGLTGGGTSGNVTLNVSQGNGISTAGDQVSLNTAYTNSLYVNEGQSNSISSSMIANSTITADDLASNSVGTSEIINGSVSMNDLADGAALDEILDDDGSGSNLNADFLDGYSSGYFSSSTHTHSGYVSTSGDTMTGALVTIFDSSHYYALKGTGQNSPTNGYFGLQGTTDYDGVSTADWTGLEIGIAGISAGTTEDDNYGVMGHSNYVGVRGEYSADPSNNYGHLGTNGTGVHGSGTQYGVRGYGGTYGIYGTGSSYGIYGTGSSYGVYGFSDTGHGVHGSSNNGHAGYFSTGGGSGLYGASLYATTGAIAGISLWAHNDNANASDATAVFSNDGSGDLLKLFGSNGGNHELDISNDGTINIYNEAHVKTIMIDPQEQSPTTDGGQITLYDNTGAVSIEIDGSFSGTGRISTGELLITGGSDLSENFDINTLQPELEPLPGMVVSIDPENTGELMVSSTPYDRRVAGIISGAGGVNPGLLMGQKDSVADGANPVALTGRVYCWADAANGAIEPGDLLTTSNTPGHAMKVKDYDQSQGAILGKSMSSLKGGRGLVLVLVSLQ